MIQPLHILNVVGARPNFMKIAPLMREYARHPEAIRATLLHTGQHYDDAMSRVFFSDLGIPEPDMNLGVGSGSHATQTAQVMMRFEEQLLALHPDIVLVVGDVNSTMACTIVAAKCQVPVAHVEAGLRSFDRTMPEEINRIITDRLADLLFTTSEDANLNLLQEGVDSKKIFIVGNTMIDSLLALRTRFDSDGIKAKYALNGLPYAFVTLHRPSNVDEPEILEGICNAFGKIQHNIQLFWPLHPRTRNNLAEHGLMQFLESMKHVIITEPLSYIESMSIMSSAKLVLTDSGGIQEETTVLGIPCLTLRNNTERPVTILEGTNELVGNNPERICEGVAEILRTGGKSGKTPKWWDGSAAERIVMILRDKIPGKLGER